MSAEANDASMVITAKTSYKKASGTLALTPTHLEWTPDGARNPSVRVPTADASSLLCSKEGAAQVRLKVVLVDDENGYQFSFTAAPQVALSEREVFKQQLANIIGKNRSANASTISKSIPQTTAANTPRASPAPQTRRSSATPGPSTGPLADQTFDFQLRKRVLLANPDLQALHRELVITGQITEQEFWEGREHLLLSQLAQQKQKKGKPGQLVDPRPETVDGEVKIRITPQLVADIFEEYPVVQKAYSENVGPNKLSEAEFWKRYFQSKLFNAHRASIRSSAAQHVAKDDPILDKYLEKDDDGLEPRRQRDESVDMFVDLGATNEDHLETGNEKDVTMQAGKQRAALPLIRKFNEHSERLLNSALGDLPPAKRRRIDDSEDIYDAQIDLEDLRASESTPGIVLEMQDRQRYFESRMSSADGVGEKEKIDEGMVIAEAKNNLANWTSNLAQLHIERKVGDTALASMTKNVVARLEVRAKKNDIPDALFTQMRTCQTAANEFLRQFWSALHPPVAVEGSTLGVQTPAQRQAKAAKMVGYLSKTHEKVDALVQVAPQHKADPQRVKVAMKPVLDAVDRALSYHRLKKAPPGRM